MARPRKPTALKLVKGTQQPCRTNKKEPKGRCVLLRPPTHLPEWARPTFEEIAEIIFRMGVAQASDGLAVEMFAMDVANIRKAYASLAARDGEHGDYYKTGDMWRTFPEVGLISDLDRRIGMWVAKFGMTGADRSKVSAIEEPIEDKWATG